MSLVYNEQLKLTATYLNTGAGACFAAGVVAPIAALAFGYGNIQSSVPTLTFVVGVATFLSTSITLHAAARYMLKGLKP